MHSWAWSGLSYISQWFRFQVVAWTSLQWNLIQTLTSQSLLYPSNGWNFLVSKHFVVLPFANGLDRIKTADWPEHRESSIQFLFSEQLCTNFHEKHQVCRGFRWVVILTIYFWNSQRFKLFLKPCSHWTNFLPRQWLTFQKGQLTSVRTWIIYVGKLTDKIGKAHIICSKLRHSTL